MGYSVGGSSLSVVPDVWLLACISEDVTTNDGHALECLSRAAPADGVRSALAPENAGDLQVGTSRAISPSLMSTAAIGRNGRERGDAASASRSPSRRSCLCDATDAIRPTQISRSLSPKQGSREEVAVRRMEHDRGTSPYRDRPTVISASNRDSPADGGLETDATVALPRGEARPLSPQNGISPESPTSSLPSGSRKSFWATALQSRLLAGEDAMDAHPSRHQQHSSQGSSRVTQAVTKTDESFTSVHHETVLAREPNTDAAEALPFNYSQHTRQERSSVTQVVTDTINKETVFDREANMRLEADGGARKNRKVDRGTMLSQEARDAIRRMRVFQREAARHQAAKAEASPDDEAAELANSAHEEDTWTKRRLFALSPSSPSRMPAARLQESMPLSPSNAGELEN